MRSRVLYLIKTFFFITIVFIIAKPIFMLCDGGDKKFVSSDIFSVIYHGLSLDISTSIYFFLIPFIATIVSLWYNGWHIIRCIMKYYYGLTACLFAIIFVADASLYSFWGFKLDSSVFQYLDSTGEAFVSVSVWYILLRVIIIAIISFLIYKIFVRLTPHTVEAIPVKTKIISTTAAIVMVVPLFIGIRGGVSEATTNIGQVYYSSNQFLNHSAVNPVFSFMSSFERTASDNAAYNFFDNKRCKEVFSGLYSTKSIDGDSLLNTRRPNILVILMEGCGGQFTEISGNPNITPNLNRLAKEGIYFTNCYGNSYRTDRGTVCTFSGYPSFPTISVMKIPSKSRTLPSVARTLSSVGYSTNFLYGGDIDFTNMRSYLLSTGYQKIFSKEDYTLKDQQSSKWGVRDDITFGTLYKQIINNKAKHWHTAFLTLSSHEPWTVPMHHFDDEVTNSFYFLDSCIGNFIGKLKKTPQWKNMLVIFIPDHGILYKDLEETKQLRNHIPMIWVGGAVKEPRRIEKICNQTDLAATLLGQLGLNHDKFTFSRDVMSKSYKYPFAIHTFNNGFSFTDSTGFTVYDLNSRKIIVGRQDFSQNHVNIGKAILQTTSNDLKNR